MAIKPKSISEAVASVISLIEPFKREERSRILRTATTFFADSSEPPVDLAVFDDRQNGSRTAGLPYSTNATMSAKQFLLEKRPQTDVERVACLAYYLFHNRNVAQFKTVDITTLNTEAAQIRFSNTATAVDNAFKQGYLAQGTKGHKQISAIGEQYVQSLPDREAARAVLAGQKSRRKRARQSVSRRGGSSKGRPRSKQSRSKA